MAAPNSIRSAWLETRFSFSFVHSSCVAGCAALLASPSLMSCESKGEQSRGQQEEGCLVGADRQTKTALVVG